MTHGKQGLSHLVKFSAWPFAEEKPWLAPGTILDTLLRSFSGELRKAEGLPLIPSLLMMMMHSLLTLKNIEVNSMKWKCKGECPESCPPVDTAGETTRISSDRKP